MRGALAVVCLLVVLAAGAMFMVKTPCGRCGGKGKMEAGAMREVPCGLCGGTGNVGGQMSHGADTKTTFSRRTIACARCGGKGYRLERVMEESLCESCGGIGKVNLWTRMVQAAARKTADEAP